MRTRILEQSNAYCVVTRAGTRTGDQIVERLDPYQLPAEDPAKVADDRVGHLLERRRGIYFSFDAGDTPVADPTGHNQGEVVEIGGHVQGEAMGGDSAGNVHAQSGDLLLRDGAPGMVQTPARPAARWVSTP